MLTSGAAGDRYGHRRVVLAGLAVFGAGSPACGLAPDVAVLVAARVAQGVGAALLLPGTLAIIGRAFREPAARARAIGVWAGIGSLAPTRALPHRSTTTPQKHDQPMLGHGQRHQGRDGEQGGGHRLGRAGMLDERVRHRRQRKAAEDHAGEVEPRRPFVDALRHHGRRPGQGEEHDRHIDQEDGPPAERLRQRATEQRPGRQPGRVSGVAVARCGGGAGGVVIGVGKGGASAVALSVPRQAGRPPLLSPPRAWPRAGPPCAAG